MSEVFVNRVFPSMANGYPSEWIATLRKAEAIAPAWFVPAHGFVDSADVLREEERNYRLAIERVVAEGKRLHDAGVPVDQALARADFGPYAGGRAARTMQPARSSACIWNSRASCKAAAPAAPSIQGRWKLLAAEDLRADGTVARYPWGRHPAGSIVVEGRRCYLQIMSTDTPAFSAATPSRVEQMKATLLSSYIAYSGPCTIDEAAGKRDAEGRGGVAARLRRHRAEAVLPVRERAFALRSGAGFDPRRQRKADAAADARPRRH